MFNEGLFLFINRQISLFGEERGEIEKGEGNERTQER